MKIQCPNCQTLGRVPSAKLPETGANIRCPACSFVFFVGGPDLLNVVHSVRANDTSAAPHTRENSQLGESSVPEARPTLTLPQDVMDDVRRRIREAATERRGGETVDSDAASGSSESAGESRTDAGSGTSAASSDTSAQTDTGGDTTHSPTPSPDASADQGPAAQGTEAEREAEALRKSEAEREAEASRQAEAEREAEALRQAEAEREAEALRQAEAEGAAEALRQAEAEAEALRQAEAEALRQAEAEVVENASQQTVLDEEAKSTTTSSRRAASATGESTSIRTSTTGQSRAVAPEPANDAQSDSETASAAPTTRKRWRLQISSGIVYDFADTEGIRKWLSGRGDHDGIKASCDGGKTYLVPGDHLELADIKPGGLRTTTASFRAIGEEDVAAAQRASGARPGVEESGAAEAVSDADRAAAQAKARDAAIERVTSKTRAVGSARKTGSSNQVDKAGTTDALAAARAKTRQLILAVVFVVVAIFGIVHFLGIGDHPYGKRIPNTPAGNQLTWVMDAWHGGARDLTEEAITARFAPETIAQVGAASILIEMQNLDRWSNRYRITAYEGSPTRTTISARMTADGNRNGIVTITTETEPPHRIIAVETRTIR